MEAGALGMVLLISRVVGVAPFLRGAEYHVSPPLLILAKLFILFTAIDFVVIAVASSYFHSKYRSLLAFDVIKITAKFFAITTTVISVFNSAERTMRVLRFLKELDQIDKQILGYLRQKTSEIKLTVMVFIYLHLCVFLRGYYFTIGKLNETIFNLFMLIIYYMINLSELQVSLFARRTMFSLKIINNSLQKLSKNSPMKVIFSQILKTRTKKPILAWAKTKEQPISTISKQGHLVKPRPEKIAEPVKLIRQCLINYLLVCDIITASNDGDGFFIVILLMRNILNLLTHSYKIILFALATGPNFVKPNIFVAIFWCVAYSVSLIVFMEPYHKTQLEIQKLQFLLTSLKWTYLDEINIDNELHLFGRVTNLNQPKYSPLGMFTLNRLLVVKIFGSLVTYLVIMVTYGPELDNLHLRTE